MPLQQLLSDISSKDEDSGSASDEDFSSPGTICGKILGMLIGAPPGASI